MFWKSKLLALFYAFVFAQSSLNDSASGTVHATPASGMGPSSYLLGLGIGDVTGPVVETNMMGYAALAQTDTGLHMRQRSRAFIVADSTNPNDRVVFINSDICMGDYGVRAGIVQRLAALYPSIYNDSNVALIGTHQHSGVAGYHNYLLPTITSLGFVRQSYEAIVNGSVNAVVQAHNSLAPGTLSIGNMTLLNTNINRSPYAYLANPAEERAQYQYDQDKDFTLVKFLDTASNKARGFLSFFAVHGTSIYENNTLVSTDNKGMAAYLYEEMENPDSTPGRNLSFIAGFLQSNVGDTSPNTLGAFCESPGQPYNNQPCDFIHATCGNATEDCHGRGPAFLENPYGYASNMIIGTNQFEAAKTLMLASNLTGVQGAVRGLHTYVNITDYSFQLANGTTVTTCPAAMGYSFAGGTTDGPGAFDFVQGDNATQPQNPFWQLVKGAVTPYPSEEQIACHYPKPILLNTGYAHSPYQWTPAVVDIQLFQIGQIVILIVPGEFTTMAGRRIRAAVRAKLISAGVLDNSAYVLIAGPSNTYSHYVTTQEEYSVQRYEGASTLYGQWTLEAYTDIYTNLVQYLVPGNTAILPTGPTPPYQINEELSLQTPVIYDSVPLFSNFGKVVADVSTSTTYTIGDSVTATLQGADPRNNLRLEDTFLTIDQQSGSTWNTWRTDSHPSTIFQWNRTNTALGYSTVTITWTIENGTPSGSYRISYYGDSKSILGSISPFSGASSTFIVSA